MIGKHFSQQVLLLWKIRTEKLGARVVTSLYVAAAGGKKEGGLEMWLKGIGSFQDFGVGSFTISRPTESVGEMLG
jgi:hypothetical protein